jgi:hypothetical protein
MERWKEHQKKELAKQEEEKK